MKPRVSIVMCTYNRAHLIAETIRSCLNQTISNWELVIADDCSSDGTESVVESFDDSRIVFLKNGTHIGRSAARNLALKNATGEFITLLDSDDLIAPNRIETDIKILEESTDEHVVYCAAETIDINTGRIIAKSNGSKHGDLYDDIAYYLPLVIATSQVTLRRQLVDLVGLFDENLDRFEDTDFFRRVSLETNWLFNANTIVTLKNHADNVISNQNQSVIVKMIDIYIRKVEDEIRERKLSTSATPNQLYIHYAQALYAQPKGKRNAVTLYSELLRRDPLAIIQVTFSVLRMIKHQIVQKRKVETFKRFTRQPKIK